MKAHLFLFALAASIFGRGVSADPPAGYRLIDLGPLDFLYTPGVSPDHTFGINQRGEVAFARDAGSGVRAAVWLPHPAWSHSEGVTELPLGSASVSFARDINDYGLVVGDISGAGSFDEAALWTLGSTIQLDPLGTFGDIGVVNERGGWSAWCGEVDGPEMPLKESLTPPSN